jgi:hypothetical protein
MLTRSIAEQVVRYSNCGSEAALQAQEASHVEQATCGELSDGSINHEPARSAISYIKKLCILLCEAIAACIDAFRRRSQTSTSQMPQATGTCSQE